MPLGSTELTRSMVVVPAATRPLRRWKSIVTRLPAAELPIGVGLQIVTPIWPVAWSTTDCNFQPLPEPGTVPSWMSLVETLKTAGS